MFWVEALKNSREFSEARFGDVSTVQGASIGKNKFSRISNSLQLTMTHQFGVGHFVIILQETFLANLGPFADLLDQYASICNEVISLFAHAILRLLETINNIGSPLEIFAISRSDQLRRHSSNCDADDVSRITCCICFIHEKSILLQPCNHICVCAHCVEELLETYEEPLCPLCRSAITSYVDVYI
uniref:RING-type domain-containing protein n=1 Tax=Wuchereria bancrofti TaxID=6293 RepID=A0A1I8EXF2_WUCBA